MADRKFGIFVQCRMREPMRQIKKAMDAGRFGRAAERLGIAPPSVSAHIAALEESA